MCGTAAVRHRWVISTLSFVLVLVMPRLAGLMLPCLRLAELEPRTVCSPQVEAGVFLPPTLVETYRRPAASKYPVPICRARGVLHPGNAKASLARGADVIEYFLSLELSKFLSAVGWNRGGEGGEEGDAGQVASAMM